METEISVRKGDLGKCADPGRGTCLLQCSVPGGLGEGPATRGRRKEYGNVKVRTERERERLLPSHPHCLPLDIMSLKRMLEKLGAPKTHLELKKLIREVSSGSGETFSYSDFLKMMLGKRSAILKM